MKRDLTKTFIDEIYSSPPRKNYLTDKIVYTVPHDIVTIETFFSKFSLCAVRKLDIFSERNVSRKHKICEKLLNARLQKSVQIEA